MRVPFRTVDDENSVSQETRQVFVAEGNGFVSDRGGMQNSRAGSQERTLDIVLKVGLLDVFEHLIFP